MHNAGLDFIKEPLWITATPSDFTKTLPFYITETGRFFAGKNYYTERSEIDSILVIYTVSGSGKISDKKNSYTVNKGDIAFIDCREYNIYSSESDLWEFYWLHMNTEAKKILDSVDINTKCELMTDASDIFERIQKNASYTDISSAINISFELHRLLNTVIKEHSKKYSEEKYDDKIAAAAEYMQKHFSEQLSIDDIAEYVHLSKYYFIRLFKRCTGTTPYKYILNIRITNAKILLRTTSLSIGIISENVGFLDESNFISVFKKQTDMKPAEYRRSFFVGGNKEN